MLCFLKIPEARMGNWVKGSIRVEHFKILIPIYLLESQIIGQQC